MKDLAWDTAMLAEKATNEALELLAESDDERLRALCGRLAQLDLLAMQAADTSLKDQDVITCCGECSAPLGEDCDFAKKPLERNSLWDCAPPEWCPLREQSYVLETVLKPFGEV
jgi:hypothetical protein